MDTNSMMLCERCGTAGATPCDIAIQATPTAPATTTLFTLCPDCQAFVQRIAPIHSEDEITNDSAWLSRIDPLIDLANEIATMQRQVDALRAKLTEKKKLLRHKVRLLEDAINEAQWSRMITEQQMAGETATVFWLERYRKR